MAANVETMFSVREKPWHGLGTIVAEAPSSSEALRLAGREDLIGTAPECLVRPSFKGGRYTPDNKKSDHNQRGRSNSQKTQKNNGYTVKNAPLPKKNKSKFDRIFGEDAQRIRREVAKMSESSGKKSSKGQKNGQKSRKK